MRTHWASVGASLVPAKKSAEANQQKLQQGAETSVLVSQGIWVVVILEQCSWRRKCTGRQREQQGENGAWEEELMGLSKRERRGKTYERGGATWG